MVKSNLNDFNEGYVFVAQNVAILQLKERHKEIAQQEKQFNIVTVEYSHSKIVSLFENVSQ